MQPHVINRANLLLGLSFAVLITAFCLQYYVDVGNLLKRWDSKDFSYCYLVPFLFLYLVYNRKNSLKDLQIRPSLLGIGVVTFSGVLYLMGKLGSIETLTYIAMWLIVVALILLILGIAIAKALAFPLIILAFIVPLPPFLNNLLTFKLKLISSSLSVKMMHLVGLSAFREGNVIDLGATQLQIVDACSGLRYVYPLLLMGLLFADLFHKKWWERVLLVVATVPVSVFANSLRIAITGFLADKVSMKVAEGFFHGFSGWLIFMVSLGCLTILSMILKLKKRGIEREKMDKVGERGLESSHFDVNGIRKSYVWIASILFLVFWGLNTALVSAQIQPRRKTFQEFPTTMGDWRGKRAYLREEILESLWADDYVQIEFRHIRTGDVLLLFVPFYEYQGTRHTAHSPVACLVGGGFAPRSRRIIQRNFPAPFGPVKIRQMVLEKNRQLVFSNYWFHQRGRIIVSEYWNKWYLFWDSLTKRRTDGALVRLEMLLGEAQDVAAAQAVLDSFTQDLMKILPEYVPD